MRKGKFILILGVILLGIIAYFINHNISRTVDINGEILLNYCYDENDCIVIYSCEKKEYTELPLKGSQAAFGSNNTVFVKDMNIYKYDIDADEMSVVYASEDLIDYFAVVGEDKLSIARDSLIFLYDINSKNEIVLAEDNGSDVHSFSDDGELLFYSNNDGMVKSVNVYTGESTEICKGWDPIVSGSNVVCRSKDGLFVKNMETGKIYEYKRAVYDYCFSPDGSCVLVETQLSFFENGLKLLLKGRNLYVRTLCSWNFEHESEEIVIEGLSHHPNRIFDWR